MMGADLALAEQAARAAGVLIRQARATRVGVVSEPGRDVKLEVDGEAEACIIGMLRERSDVPILGEESGDIAGRGSSASRRRWIVDPLDGSFNCLRGIPFYGVSIALWDGDEPVLGVVYDVARSEMFTGVVGEGACLDGEPIHVSDVRTPDKAVLCAGFPVGADFTTAALTAYVEDVRTFKKTRMLGSAALSLATVAAGRADAYYERGIKVWDVAAGLALVKAAGGVIVTVPAAAPQTFNVYAGNAVLSPLATRS